MTIEAKAQVADAVSDKRIKGLGLEHAFAIIANEVYDAIEWTDYQTGVVTEKNRFNYELMRVIQTVANVANEAVNTDAVWKSKQDGAAPNPKGLGEKLDRNRNSARAIMATFDKKDPDQVKRLNKLKTEAAGLNNAIGIMDYIEDMAAEAMEHHTGFTYTRYNPWLFRKPQAEAESLDLDAEAIIAEAMAMYGDPANTDKPKAKKKSA